PGARGYAVRSLGLPKVAAQALQLGVLVEGLARSLRPGQPLARSLGLLDGILPITVQLHDLGAVHEAKTAKRHQIGLRVTPATERRSPLRRPPHIEDLLAGVAPS